MTLSGSTFSHTSFTLTARTARTFLTSPPSPFSASRGTRLLGGIQHVRNCLFPGRNILVAGHRFQIVIVFIFVIVFQIRIRRSRRPNGSRRTPADFRGTLSFASPSDFPTSSFAIPTLPISIVAIPVFAGTAATPAAAPSSPIRVTTLLRRGQTGLAQGHQVFSFLVVQFLVVQLLDRLDLIIILHLGGQAATFSAIIPIPTSGIPLNCFRRRTFLAPTRATTAPSATTRFFIGRPFFRFFHGGIRFHFRHGELFIAPKIIDFLGWHRCGLFARRSFAPTAPLTAFIASALITSDFIATPLVPISFSNPLLRPGRTIPSISTPGAFPLDASPFTPPSSPFVTIAAAPSPVTLISLPGTTLARTTLPVAHFAIAFRSLDARPLSTRIAGCGLLTSSHRISPWTASILTARLPSDRHARRIRAFIPLPGPVGERIPVRIIDRSDLFPHRFHLGLRLLFLAEVQIVLDFSLGLIDDIRLRKLKILNDFQRVLRRLLFRDRLRLHRANGFRRTRLAEQIFG